MKNREWTDRRAFTIVELLVVIGIIVLLIAILLPTLSRAREQANQTKCMSNMRQLGLGFIAYAGRHQQGGFICFVDGHVEWFSLAQVEKPFTTSPLDYNDPTHVIWDPFGPEN